MIIPVILCGGSGTRLWPLSREFYPKQLLQLTGEQTLLQQTVTRLTGMKGIADPIVICNQEHRFLVAEQLRQANVHPAAIILEPVGRNTAPAVSLACFHALAHDHKDSLILVLPADHLIQDVTTFQSAILVGAGHAAAGAMVTFGIIPEKPETGYGYIKQGALLENIPPAATEDISTHNAYRIAEFIEKPDFPTAKGYIDDGSYFWNSGMFLFGTKHFMAEIQKHNERMTAACRKAYAGSVKDLDFLRVDKDAFTNCPSDSIDYAVMEKTSNGIVIPIDVGWNDIGSWSALWDIGPQDNCGNVIRGDVIVHDSHDSFFYSSDRLIAAVGIEDSVIIETNDAILVARKDRVQDVKKIVSQLKTQGRSETNLHRRVFRPWGSYEEITTGERFQVKLITVNPGAILSLQMHHHRAEHWVVVKGTAKIIRGEKEFILGENESTFIPLAVTHRLENPGVIPLELIEVQSGSYLGEDDIVRFKDHYGRVEEIVGGKDN